MIERILELDPRPYPNDGSRNVASWATADTSRHLPLRCFAVPAFRAERGAGFANDFEVGKWIDHWVVEFWDETRWVMLDAQIDHMQREAIGLAADPTDLPAGLFLPAGTAWLRCQAGLEDGDRFGILDMWGQWFIEGNIARDLAALNKVEMLPWDGWGDLAGMGNASTGFVDEIAALTVSNDHRATRERYDTDARLRVPSRVTSFFTPAGPTEVDVPELA